MREEEVKIYSGVLALFYIITDWPGPEGWVRENVHLQELSLTHVIYFWDSGV